MQNSPEENEKQPDYIKNQQSENRTLKDLLKNLPPQLIIAELIILGAFIYFFFFR